LPLIHSTYRPPWWAKNRHVQTIFSAKFRKLNWTSSREIFNTPDGDFMDLDWSLHQGNELMILSYGIVASIQSSCVIGMVKQFTDNGFDAVVWNPRGSNRPNHLRKYSHCGSSDDLSLVIDHILKTKKYQNIVLVGLSLGGNVILKYLGEMGSNIPRQITKSVVISPPFCIGSTTNSLKKPHNYLYHKDIVSKLKSMFRNKINTKPDQYNDIHLEQIETLEEYLDQVTVKTNEFIDLQNFYLASSSKYYLSDISIPTLAIHSIDDPIVEPETLPTEICRSHPFVSLELTKHGGHLGFMMDSINGAYYSETRAFDFIRE
jgi:hypothetical protein